MPYGYYYRYVCGSCRYNLHVGVWGALPPRQHMPPAKFFLHGARLYRSPSLFTVRAAASISRRWLQINSYHMNELRLTCSNKHFVRGASNNNLHVGVRGALAPRQHVPPAKFFLYGARFYRFPSLFTVRACATTSTKSTCSSSRLSGDPPRALLMPSRAASSATWHWRLHAS